MKLHHIGYVVANIQRACEQFCKEGARKITNAVDDPLQKVTVQFLAFNDGNLLELVCPLGDDSPIGARLKRGGGLDHLCFSVDDLDDTLTEEKTAGAKVICPPIFAVALNRKIAFVMRRSGMIVEFVEAKQGDWPV